MRPDPGAAPAEMLEDQLGLTFIAPEILLTALTHRSFLNEVDSVEVADNERLEFLGDALVDFVAGDYLYRRLPAAREGELTTLRSALVCEAALARFADRMGLGAYLRLGRGEAASGGRDRPAILCNAFEALVGAIYLDQGFAPAEAFVMGFFEPELEAVLSQQRLKDAKSSFQEIAQRRWQITPQYRTLEESGPDHDKRFVVAVAVGDTVWGTGRGRSKAEAARSAAREALEQVAEPEWMEADSAVNATAAAGSVDRAIPRD